MHKITLFSSWRKSEVGQAQILAALVFLFLIPTTVIIAQNATNATDMPEISITGDVSGIADQPPTETANNTPEVSSETADLGIPPEAILPLVETLQNENQNASDTETVEQSQNDTEGGIESHQDLENSSINEENESVNASVFTGLEENETIPLNQSENLTEINETQEGIQPSEENTSEILNDTSPEIIPEENTTESNTSNTTEVVVQLPEDVVQQLPIITVSISGPEIILRGEESNFSVEIINEGNATALNLSGKWVVPEGFYLPEGQEGFSCGDLEPDSSCQTEISLSTSLLTGAGLSDIKVRVTYHG